MRIRSLLAPLVVAAAGWPQPANSKTVTLSLHDAVQLARLQSPAARRIALEEEQSRQSYSAVRRGLWPSLSLDLSAPEWSQTFAVAALPSAPVDTLAGDTGEAPRLVYGKTTTTSRNAGGGLRFRQLLPWRGTFSADGSFMHHDEETSPAGVRSPRKDFEVGTSLGLDIPIVGDDPDRRAQRRATIDFEAARTRERAARAALDFETMSQYLQLQRAGLALASAASEDTAAALAAALAGRKLAAGLVAPVDQMRMQVHRAERAAAQASARAAVARATDAFKVHLGLPLADSLVLVEELRPFDFDADPTPWVAQALGERTEIGLLEHDIELLEIDRAARRPAWPQVSLAARYGGGASEAQLESALRGLSANDLSLRLTAQVPLWDGGRTSSEDAAARLEIDLQRLEVETTRARIELEVRDAVRELEDAARRARIHGDSEPLARELLRISTERYERGAIDTQAYLSAQADAAAARLAKSGALIDMYLARARLRFVTMTGE